MVWVALNFALFLYFSQSYQKYMMRSSLQQQNFFQITIKSTLIVSKAFFYTSYTVCTWTVKFILNIFCLLHIWYVTYLLDIILNFVKERGDVANATDKVLRGEAFWSEIMGTNSKALGFWTDWFTKENCERVITRFVNNIPS